MPLHHDDHICQKTEIIESFRSSLESFRSSLGDGRVNFINMDNRLQRMEEVLNTVKDQTIKTNGRVGKLERFMLISRVAIITAIFMILASRFGIFELIMKLV